MKFLLLVFLIGCSSTKINYKMPSLRFNTPEVTGGSLADLDLKGRVNANYGGSNRISTSNIIGESIGTGTAEVALEGSSQVGLRIDLSIFDPVDFYINYAMDAPTTGGLKWQFMGKSEGAFSEGWKSSFAVGLGGSKTGNKVIPIENSSTSTYVVASNDLAVYDFNYHFGYRFPERLLVYLNLNSTFYTNDISFQEGASAAQTNEVDTNNWGIIFGAQYYFKSKNSFLIAELGYSKGQIEDMADNDILTAGINFGWRFE